MQMVDLTHPISSSIPVFPGDPVPVLTPLCTIEADGCRVTGLSFGSHTGTHIDSPAHLFSEGKTLGQYAVSSFSGSGWAIDCSGHAGEIGPDALDGVPAADFLLFYTGWSRYWETPDYLSGFPTFSRALAIRLAARRCKGVGFDTLSPDPVDSAGLFAHRTLLGQNTLLLENLADFGQITGKPFSLCAAPLLFAGADGAPARIAAILE
ncbi:MAG: cyclase family protein [Anaerotruncus rubiinfantis]|jgi:arylformamidase|uniref:cyclase family protein n=1 Tax=Anaerotruncus rubiinfantis TaxID=1720200 RepID=UPI00189B4C97|nr:cyclase family protein [Anaerotruncus rubiinfantis]